MNLKDGRAVPLLGAGAVLCSLVAVLGSLALAPWFSPAGNPLSDLGTPGRATAPLFNGGLIASGLLGSGFVYGVWRRSTNFVERLGVALFAIVTVLVILIGAFPTTHPYHYPVSLGFYVVLTYALFVHGTGDVLAGQVSSGMVTIWIGVAHTTSWLLWLALRDEVGIAIPEAIGAVVISTWVLRMVSRVRR